MTLVALIFLSTTAFCQDHEYLARHLKESRIIFPETESWFPAKDMKHASKEFINQVEPILEKTVHESSERDFLTRNGPVIDGEPAFSPDNFFIYDIDMDGLQDIIYMGILPGGELDITIIWFKTKDGYAININSFRNWLLVSIKKEKPVQICSIAAGCCDDPSAEYDIDYLMDPEGRRSCKLVSMIVFPEKGCRQVKFTSLKNNLILRTAPIVDDTYDKGYSEENRTAIFGNILSKYLPGVNGHIMGKKTDEQSRIWYFVYLDDKSFALRTHSPYTVNAGWVKAEDIKLLDRE